MRNWTQILRQESPVDLAMEFAWRTRKNWRKKHILARMDKELCPVMFRPVPYYASDPSAFADSSRATIAHFADEICAGRYPFLGYGTVDLGRHPKWNLDFVSGLDWPHVPLENGNCTRFDGSDVKAPWELSRLQFLPVLGKAHVLTGNEPYREEAKRLLSRWLKDNPVGVGVNWSIAMEAALRGVSICLLLSLLAPFRPTEKQWVADVTRSLWEHMTYIEAHLEFSHLMRSNHYLSNILGLYCIAVFLDGSGMREKRQQYRQRIEAEILHQVYEDGGDFEASIGYHVLVAQMFTCALLLTRADGATPGENFLERLRGMHDYLSSMASSSGQLPNVGDCDDGRVELLLDDLEQMLRTPVEQRNSLQVANFLSQGAHLFQNGFQPEGIQNTAPAEAASAKITVFPQSGIAIARARRADLLFFAIPNGIDGKGSHTHNDKLSVVLRVDGQEALCDSGTGCYTRDPVLRNRLRATRVHNTVIVDDREQNTIDHQRAGLFRIGNEAKVSLIDQGVEQGIPFVRASHTGYRALGIEHTRTIQLPKNAEMAVIEDHLSGDGKHSFEVNFQIAPGWSVAKIERKAAEIVCHLSGPKKLTIAFKALNGARADSFDTVVSRTYGGVTPAARLCFSGEAEFPVRLTTQLNWAN